MLRKLAQIISIVFHPLFILTYMLALLLLVNPYLFGVSGIHEKISKLLLLRVFLSTFFIPAFAVLMFRLLGLVKSLELEERTERIGPYILTGMFYVWMFYNFFKNASIPSAYTSFVLGSVIALFLAFFINNFSKISAHAVGMGGLVGMVLITTFLFSYDFFTISFPFGEIDSTRISMTSLLLLTVVLAGVVCTARLILHAHRPQDVYGGFLVGLAAQLIALPFIF